MPEVNCKCPFCEYDSEVCDSDILFMVCSNCGDIYLVEESDSYKEALATSDAEFVVTDGCLIKYRGSSTDVIIPEGIKLIGHNIFDHPGKITSVTIPEGVDLILGSFEYCYSLTSISIPNSVTYISANSFNTCESLTNVVLPEGLKKIRTSTFFRCSSLESIRIPSSVSIIDDEAFEHCEMLSNVILSEGLKEIGASAFSNCRSLESIRIPSSVSKIYGLAFADCKMLSNVILSEGLKEIGFRAFASCSALKSIHIPSSVNYIGREIFHKCKKLTQVCWQDQDLQYTDMDTFWQTYGDLRCAELLHHCNTINSQLYNYSMSLKDTFSLELFMEHVHKDFERRLLSKLAYAKMIAGTSTYKRGKKYYFINETTKEIDHLRIIDIFEDEFMYSHKEEYKFCSFKNAEGKLYEYDNDAELLSKLGTTEQKCACDTSHHCKPHTHCPCPEFFHACDAPAKIKLRLKSLKKLKHTPLETDKAEKLNASLLYFLYFR